MPPENEVELVAAEHLYASLSGLRKPFLSAFFSGQYRISLEIVSKADGIGFYVVVPDEIASLVEKQVNGAYPEAEIDIVNPNEIWDRGKFTQVAELKLRGAPYFPIKNFEEAKTDPLNILTSAMSKLNKDEVVAVQFVIAPAKESWRSAGRKYVNNIKAKLNDPEKKYNLDPSFLEGIEKKIVHSGFDTAIRIIAIAETQGESQLHINSLITSFDQFADPVHNKFIVKHSWKQNKANFKLIDNFIYRRINLSEFIIPILDIILYKETPVLSTAELASLYHFPNKNVQTPNIKWLTARKSAAPSNIPDEGSGIWIGESYFRGVKKQIHIKEKDRTRHFYIIGQTGTGKSELLKYMALQDIRNGEGVAVIDPHGSDVQDLLTKIPEERVDDVILWNVSDTTRPMGLNMLEARTEEEQHLVINAFIALLYKLYDPNRQGIMGPQLERAIRNVMLTAMTDPSATMVDVLRLLIDTKYAQKFIDNIKDPMVKRFWTDEMAKTSDFHKSEKMGYFVSKFDKFVTDKLMRNILGQPKSAFNLADIMAQKKILLVDLAKGKIGEENSNFLGLLLVPRILTSALARHSLLEQGVDFPGFYLYVDEFQNFATPDFATILSEARKYKLNLTVAHQFVAQLSDEIKDAIFGNVGSMSVFRVGTEDAEFLETYFNPPFTKKDISGLPIGNAYVRLLVEGHPTQPF
ncbi:MAG TPA: DUF87 domain-containing protein, partial [Bacteroidia bacterium]|nr:DUF87 domain-containing protein [Bacteroidia bacterium]